MTLFCTASPADDLTAVVSFVRRTGDKEVNYGDVMQFPDKCITNATNAGYVVECGPFANSKTAEVKKYMLHINKCKEADFTEWLCQLKGRKHDNSTLTLHHACK